MCMSKKAQTKCTTFGKGKNVSWDDFYCATGLSGNLISKLNEG